MTPWEEITEGEHGPCRLCETQDALYETSLVLSNLTHKRGDIGRIAYTAMFLICGTCFKNFTRANESHLDEQYCTDHDGTYCPNK